MCSHFCCTRRFYCLMYEDEELSVCTIVSHEILFLGIKRQCDQYFQKPFCWSCLSKLWEKKSCWMVALLTKILGHEGQCLRQKHKPNITQLVMILQQCCKNKNFYLLLRYPEYMLQGSKNEPSENSAVVGGNSYTSLILL